MKYEFKIIEDEYDDDGERISKYDIIVMRIRNGMETFHRFNEDSVWSRVGSAMAVFIDGQYAVKEEVKPEDYPEIGIVLYRKLGKNVRTEIKIESQLFKVSHSEDSSSWDEMIIRDVNSEEAVK